MNRPHVTACPICLTPWAETRYIIAAANEEIEDPCTILSCRGRDCVATFLLVQPTFSIEHGISPWLLRHFGPAATGDYELG